MHRMTAVLPTALLLLTILPGPLPAAGNVEHGKVLAEPCMGCHGIPGYRNAYPSFRVPKLGGQHEDYLVIALQGYKSKMRSHGTMQAQAASLSEQDMRDLAAYFAGEAELSAGEPVRTGRAAAGAEKVAVCTACHGANGVSPAPNWPVLAGQHEDYLVHAITAYRDGGRKDPVMMGQAVSLTDQDIADIAAFYAAQAGLYTVSYAD